MSPTNVLIMLLLFLAAGFAGYWFNRASARGGRPATPGVGNTAIGFGTNFFDTLGIGSFATTTTIYRLFRRVDDQHIPGTLNVGHALPTVAQAWIYTTLVQVDFATLALLIVAAVGGSWIGAAIVVAAAEGRDPARHGRGAAPRRGADGDDCAQPDAGRRRGHRPSRRHLILACAHQLRPGRADDARHRPLRALHDHGEPAGHEPHGGLSDHDGLVRVPDAGGRRCSSSRPDGTTCARRSA